MGDIRKAAVLLTTLPEEEAADILQRLEPKQVEMVSIEIAKLKSITSEEQEQIILQFAESNPGATADGGGLDRAKNLVQKAFGKNATGTLDTIRQAIEEVPFAFLRTVDSQNILTYVIDEHPQTIALVLSQPLASVLRCMLQTGGQPPTLCQSACVGKPLWEPIELAAAI